MYVPGKRFSVNGFIVARLQVVSVLHPHGIGNSVAVLSLLSLLYVLQQLGQTCIIYIWRYSTRVDIYFCIQRGGGSSKFVWLRTFSNLSYPVLVLYFHENILCHHSSVDSDN